MTVEDVASEAVTNHIKQLSPPRTRRTPTPVVGTIRIAGAPSPVEFPSSTEELYVLVEFRA